MKHSQKTLVITGSSGFVGEKLAITAISEGFNVIGLDIKRSNKLNCNQLEIDLSKEDFWEKIPQQSSIVHLASLSTDSMCKENPILAIDANLRATALVLANAKKSNARHLFFASSEWVYPEQGETTNQKESDVLDLTNLNSLYAMTKLFGESLIRSSSEVAYTILRFGIVYGPRKVPGSAAESLALKVSENEVIKVGSKYTSRRFIYIDDLISGILKSVSMDADSLNSKIFNLAGSELISLEKIVQVANQILGKASQITDSGNFASIRNPIIDEAVKVLKWHPEVSFREGLENCLKMMGATQE